MAVDRARIADDLADPDLQELLSQLVDGSFVLVNPDGSITRWGPRAEALFGWAGPEATGWPISERLFCPPGEGTWQKLLEGREARTQIEAGYKEGQRFRCELYLIPIRLSDGLAFNVFLQELESQLSREWKLRRIPRAHQQALEVLATTLRNGPRFGEEERLAGAIVAFRPLEPAPWLKTAPPPTRDGAVPGPTRPTAEAEAERLAVVSQARHGLDEARRETEAARVEAAAARAEAEAAVARIDDLAREAHAAREQAAEAQRLAEAALGHERQTAVGQVAEELERLRDAGAAIRREADESRRAAAEGRSRAAEAAAELEAVRAEVRAARTAAEASRTEAEQAHAAVESALEEAQAAHSEAAAASREARESRATADEARPHAESAGRELAGARDRLMADMSEPAAEAVPWQERPRAPQTRPPREGFDDVPVGMAVIALDGHFEELNPRFSELIGYGEGELRAASWPSIGDHDHLEEHRELMRQLLVGQREEAHVETYYMGGSGLLVAISGSIRVVRDDAGEPVHFLLTLDEPAS